MDTYFEKEQVAIQEAVKNNHQFLNPLMKTNQTVSKVKTANRKTVERTVGRVVSLVGRQFFYALNSGMCYDAEFMRKIVDSTVNDVPDIMQKMGIVALKDQLSLKDLATILNGTHAKRKDAKVRIMGSAMLEEKTEEEKTEHYLKQIQHMANDELKALRPKKKRVRSKKNPSITVPTTTIAATQSSGTSNAAHSDSSLSNFNPSSPPSTNRVMPVVLEECTVPQESGLVMVKLSSLLIKKLRDISEKLSTSNTKGEEKRILEVINAVLNSIEE